MEEREKSLRCTQKDGRARIASVVNTIRNDYADGDDGDNNNNNIIILISNSGAAAKQKSRGPGSFGQDCAVALFSRCIVECIILTKPTLVQTSAGIGRGLNPAWSVHTVIYRVHTSSKY